MEDLTSRPGGGGPCAAPEPAEPGPPPAGAPDPCPPEPEPGEEHVDIGSWVDPDPKWQRRGRALGAFAAAGARRSLALSAALFALYMGGSMYAPGIPDPIMFALLRLLLWAAALLSLFSIAVLALCVRRLVEAPSARAAGAALLRLFLALLGALLAMFSHLVSAMARGG